jgi:hypothetical protein
VDEVDALNALLKVYDAANDKTELVSNQGQAMDGFSELANYRAILRDFYATDNNSTPE